MPLRFTAANCTDCRRGGTQRNGRYENAFHIRVPTQSTRVKLAFLHALWRITGTAEREVLSNSRTGVILIRPPKTFQLPSYQNISLSAFFFSFVKPHSRVGGWKTERGRDTVEASRHVASYLPPGTQWYAPGQRHPANRCQLSSIIRELTTNLLSTFPSRRKTKPEHCGFHTVPNHEQRLNPLFAFVIREDGWKEGRWSLNSIITLD